MLSKRREWAITVNSIEECVPAINSDGCSIYLFNERIYYSTKLSKAILRSFQIRFLRVDMIIRPCDNILVTNKTSALGIRGITTLSLAFEFNILVHHSRLAFGFHIWFSIRFLFLVYHSGLTFGVWHSILLNRNLISKATSIIIPTSNCFGRKEAINPGW